MSSWTLVPLSGVEELLERIYIGLNSWRHFGRREAIAPPPVCIEEKLET
ncbi:hypothetical protein H6G00_33125 [Leptolyngbya sp. FACHB-541]|nr:hypothetical protein [Leptolyngbya sp. FACHB-541]MBD2001384.1 hypothetical protein [Leptolyngbya sp. FACHB-541]